MTKQNRPRMRHFARAGSQQHITSGDHYLYKTPEPLHRLAIVGTGTIGQEHMRVANLLGRARIHGVFDIETHSVEAAVAEYSTYCSESFIQYSSLQALCEDDALDAILICTPNHTHIDVLKAVIVTGKPLFLEKPMATTLADAAEIVGIERDYASFIQMGLQYRYKAQYVEAFHEVLARNILGDVKTISMSEHRPPFLDKVGQWNKFEAYSGGTLVEKCCHYFDLINLLARGRPSRVFASGGQAVNFLDFSKGGKAADVHDHSFVIIEYSNGIRANFTLNMFCPDFDEELVVVGQKGRLLAREKFSFQGQTRTQTTLAIETGEQGASRSVDLAYAAEIESSGHHGSTYYEHQAFLDQLEGKTADAATVQQGLWAMLVASAAQHSIATGQAVDINEFIVQHGLADALAPR
jgi:myo-inositol 2-dehydrogenase / D-chiro-inositol 1-dehydrogenase